MTLAVPAMKAGPFGIAVQAEIPNHRKLRRLGAGVVSVAVKARSGAGVRREGERV
jgi:hypothetical protein